MTQVRYASKTDYPEKPIEVIGLKDITHVDILQNAMFQQEGYHYFEIQYHGYRIIFALTSQEKTERWVKYLKDSINFAKFYKNLIEQQEKNGESIEQNSTQHQPPRFYKYIDLIAKIKNKKAEFIDQVISFNYIVENN